MIDLLVLFAMLVGAGAAGLACLRVVDGLPRSAGERLLGGIAVGLGLGGLVGLGLAAAGCLRVGPIAAIGALALLAGGRELAGTMAGVAASTRRQRDPLTWGLLVVCAVVLASELPAMLAPPIGGDQTKYHLVYPRLYALQGGLVETPWTFWGQVQFLQNFLFAIGFALRGDVLARLLNGALGVLAACALGGVGRRLLGRRGGLVTGALFFTLPMSWSLMTRAGSDFGVVLYLALAVSAVLDWMDGARAGDLHRAAVAAGMAGGSKFMGLLVPALIGLAVVVVLVRRAVSLGRLIGVGLGFAGIVLVCALPCYVRNAIDTGNPLYPFGYTVFGGRHWSAAASVYLEDYYRQYRSTHAERRQGSAYAGLDVLRFPWDLTMHPGSFENAARQSQEVGPFLLAFAPALVLVRRRRAAVWLTAAVGLGYAAIIAGGAWAHPRYVLPGVALALVAAMAAARALLGARGLLAVLVLTVAGNLALTTRLFRPLWPDQVRVALGRLAPDAFLRRHSSLYAFWERANAAVPSTGRILVLEKVPHPYYIERPFVLASYLEQGMIDYREVRSADALARVGEQLGITHVAVDLTGLDRAGDPFEAGVQRLWREFTVQDGELVVREDGYALYAVRPATAAVAAERADG